jgi:hypothetical protein
MADASDFTSRRRTSAETAPKLVKLSAPRVHPRSRTGGVLPACTRDFRRMANVGSDRSNRALCCKLQSRRNRRLLKLN